MRKVFVLAFAAVPVAFLLSQCSDSSGPPPPSVIAILSGNMQQSLHGTFLPDPLAVIVKNDDGSVAKDATVIFSPIAGGGAVSPGRATTDARGVAMTRLRLGQALGVNRVRALVEGTSRSVVFEAMSSNFLCPEVEDTLRICGSCPTSYGSRGHVFLATMNSALFPSTSTAIIELNPFGQPTATPFTEIPASDFITTIIWDLAFSPRGDLYIAARDLFPQIFKIDVTGAVTAIATLDATGIQDHVEIALNPIGLLVGCDGRGPFAVGCRDTLVRFDAATFAGGINDDAVTVDPRRQSTNPLGEDIYFINKNDSTLLRLALDSLSVEPRGLEMVAQLTRDEALGANGMACDNTGTVYILVDTPDTKVILQVTALGVKTTLVDFFTARDPARAGGVQRDLALQKPRLFTLDTLNNQLLIYDLGGQFFELFADSLEQVKLSTVPAVGERVGLDVLP